MRIKNASFNGKRHFFLACSQSSGNRIYLCIHITDMTPKCCTWIFFIGLLFFILPVYSQSSDTAKSAIRVEGNLMIQGGLYSIKGIKARQPAQTYLVQSNFTLFVKQIELPFHFVFSNNQRDFRQPFNQFGMSPMLGKFSFDLGYRAPVFSQFSYAGHIALGAGAYYEGKKLRLGVFTGRTQKAVEEDTTLQIGDGLNDVPYPAYKRWVTAGKIGFGNKDRFIDLIYLHGRDDSSSLMQVPQSIDLKPAQNDLIALNSKLSFLKKKLIWSGEVSVSVYTRDIMQQKIKTEIPWVDNFFAPSISTIYNRAFESKLEYNERNFGGGLKIRQIDPDYKSMGAYFFQSDLRQSTAFARGNMFKQKLTVQANAGLQSDNTTGKKAYTTHRNIYGGSVSINPDYRFGIDIQFSNYGTSQQEGRLKLSDTFVLNQVNRYVFSNVRYTQVKESGIRQFMLMGGYQTLIDNNRYSATFSEMDMYFGNFIYTRELSEKQITYSAMANYNQNITVAGTLMMAGLSGSLSKNIQNKVIWEFNSSLNAATFNGSYNGILWNAVGVLRYKPRKKHLFELNGGITVNESANSAAGDSFRELNIRLTYVMQF